MKVLKDETAAKLAALLGEVKVEAPPSTRAPRTRSHVLVRCTSDTAVGGSGEAALCYPGVVLNPASDDLNPGPEELGEVWLTVWGVSGAEVPTENQVYTCVVSGELDINDDERARCHSGAQVSSGAEIANGQDYTIGAVDITPDSTWVDTGVSVTLPEAGTYLILATVTVDAWMSAGTAGVTIEARVWSTTNSEELPNDSGDKWVIVKTIDVVNIQQRQTTHWSFVHEADGAETIRIEAIRPAGTWTWCRILDGRVTRLVYVKLS